MNRCRWYLVTWLQTVKLTYWRFLINSCWGTNICKDGAFPVERVWLRGLYVVGPCYLVLCHSLRGGAIRLRVFLGSFARVLAFWPFVSTINKLIKNSNSFQFGPRKESPNYLGISCKWFPKSLTWALRVLLKRLFTKTSESPRNAGSFECPLRQEFASTWDTLQMVCKTLTEILHNWCIWKKSLEKH